MMARPLSQVRQRHVKLRCVTRLPPAVVPISIPDKTQMGDHGVIGGVRQKRLGSRLGPAERGYRTSMRATQRMTTPTVGSPLLRLTSPPPTVTSDREGYAVAETIMRSAAHAKRAERPEPTPNGARPAHAAR